MDSVDFNAVNPSFSQALGGLTEGLNHLMDFLDGHRAGLDILSPAVGGGGGRGAGILHVHYRGGKLVEQIVLCQHGHPAVYSHRAAKASGELNEELRAGLMELIHIGLESLEHSVILIQPLSAGDTHGITHALHAGQDKADAVLRAVEQEVCRLFVEMVRLQPAEKGSAAHGALHEAVLNLHITNLPWCK